MGIGFEERKASKTFASFSHDGFLLFFCNRSICNTHIFLDIEENNFIDIRIHSSIIIHNSVDFSKKKYITESNLLHWKQKLVVSKIIAVTGHNDLRMNLKNLLID